MDIIKQAEEEIRIFERPSVETSKALMVEVESLRREVERKTALLASIHEDLFLRKSDEGVVPLSNWIWGQLKELLKEGAAG